jgi:hypothetical protein
MAKHNLMLGKKLVGVPVEPEMLEKIDKFRDDYEFFSRAEAAKWLVEWALSQGARPPEKKKQTGRYKKARFKK